jgi:hypothetical protein
VAQGDQPILASLFLFTFKIVQNQSNNYIYKIAIISAFSQVIQIQQAGKQGFANVTEGCYIPYDYDGPLLHDDA